MKEVLVQLDNIQFDHRLWLNELIFSAREIELYQKRSAELLSSLDDKEKIDALTTIFEEFDKLKKLAINLQKKIKKHVIIISQLAHSNGSLMAMINSNHNETRREMETFRHQHATLKENFHRFSALQD